ncbi:M24 family metallopeptidase [Anaeromicropila herbilytica]|uniref:Aminopeptidase n=1 Tax=Anaeromicropila herbilytica TaxID=2785025 RepID=A0A7R7EJP8_9FIRM|nr:Xaa-Pro peptidase family protein [Anaeromicropila herbilytica]BCN29984.1 aminopeptidase [Anaeromicropila herbilytica]
MENKKKVIEVLDKLGLDAVLVSDGYNMRYLSGFSGETGYLFISRNKSVIITDFRYTIQAKSESKDFEVVEISKGYMEPINELIASEQVKTLGFEDGSMIHRSFSGLKEKLHVEKLVPVNEELNDLRIIKTPYELECIRKAEEIGDIAFSKILDIIKPGMTELEVAAHIEFLMKTNGADKLSFDTIACSGINTSMPHATPSNKKIENGDFLTMDFGCKYNGYCSDMTRTIVVGKASDEQKKVYNTVLEAQLAALDYIKAGYQGKEIDKVARDIIYKAGYEGCFGHGLGHSVGLFIHESPRLSPTEEKVIRACMTETVEPGIYIEGFGGVRIEDLVQVTEDGHINFTKSDKKLIEL